jgi:hypothetical protein
VAHLEVREPQKEQKIDIAVENSALHASKHRREWWI